MSPENTPSDDSNQETELTMDDIDQTELDKIAGGRLIVEPIAGEDIDVAHMNPHPL